MGGAQKERALVLAFLVIVLLLIVFVVPRLSRWSVAEGFEDPRVGGPRATRTSADPIVSAALHRFYPNALGRVHYGQPLNSSTITLDSGRVVPVRTADDFFRGAGLEHAEVMRGAADGIAASHLTDMCAARSPDQTGRRFAGPLEYRFSSFC